MQMRRLTTLKQALSKCAYTVLAKYYTIKRLVRLHPYLQFILVGEDVSPSNISSVPRQGQIKLVSWRGFFGCKYKKTFFF